MKTIYLFYFSIFFSSCAVHRTPSLNMLEKRSDYEGSRQIKKELSSLQGPLLVPQRTESKITDIWIHPHEMPTGDYFRGGWIRTIISHSQWSIK